MTDDLIESTTEALRIVELIKFSMAEEVSRLKSTGEWKDFVRGDEAQQPGTRPSTFRKYLEEYTREVRDRVPGGVSTGQIEDWVASYEWLSGLGFQPGQMALLGTEAVKLLRKQNAKAEAPEQGAAVESALAELQLYGKFHLPAFRSEGKVQPVLHVKDLGNSYQLTGLTLIADGVPFRNQYPKEKLHWLSKRLRAAVEVSE